MIRGLIESSFIDWEGKISMVIFFDKCNFRCSFCHNWKLISQSEKFPVIEWARIHSILQEKRKWIDGVVLTGGEPLVNFQETAELCSKIKPEGFLIKLDTNGTFPESLRALIDQKLIDYVAMDIKAPLDDRYNTATRVKADIASIKSSIQLIMHSYIQYEFRTTCVPDIIDENAIHAIGNTIKGAQKWALQGYRPENAWAEEFRQPLLTGYHQNVKKLHSIAKKYVENSILRGVTA